MLKKAVRIVSVRFVGYGIKYVNEFITLLDELQERETLLTNKLKSMCQLRKSSNIKNSLVTPDTEDLVQIYKSSMNK